MNLIPLTWWVDLTADADALCVAQCPARLRLRPEPSFWNSIGSCSSVPSDTNDKKAKAKIRSMSDSHKGEKCVLVANGPSLNKIRWDWQDNFNVVMGMNKIFLGLERYNISKMTHCARGCPALCAEWRRPHPHPHRGARCVSCAQMARATRWWPSSR